MVNQEVFCIFEEVFPSALVALTVFLERVTDPLYCMTSLKCEDGLNDEFKIERVKLFCSFETFVCTMI